MVIGLIALLLSVLVPASGLAQTPLPTPPPVCVGDCNGDRQVTIDEIITMVGLVLRGGASPSTCSAAAQWCSSFEVGIVCLIQAVNSALYGCPTLAACITPISWWTQVWACQTRPCIDFAAPSDCCWLATVYSYGDHVSITSGSSGCGDGAVCVEGYDCNCQDPPCDNFRISVGGLNFDVYTEEATPTVPPPTPTPTHTPIRSPTPTPFGGCVESVSPREVDLCSEGGRACFNITVRPPPGHGDQCWMRKLLNSSRRPTSAARRTAIAMSVLDRCEAACRFHDKLNAVENKILGDRYGLSSTIIANQLLTTQRHAHIGDFTLVDAIL